jgi:hypothetical protein
VLQKRLNLKSYKLFTVQHFERWIFCTPFSVLYWNIHSLICVILSFILCISERKRHLWKCYIVYYYTRCWLVCTEMIQVSFVLDSCWQNVIHNLQECWTRLWTRTQIVFDIEYSRLSLLIFVYLSFVIFSLHKFIFNHKLLVNNPMRNDEKNIPFCIPIVSASHITSIFLFFFLFQKPMRPIS